MSADRILRTGSAVVVLEEVPDGEENKPYLTAQTLSYGEEDGSGELQVRNVLDSTGKVGPNSTYKYAELTSYFTLWGVDNDKGGVTVSMTGENGYAPEGQVVKDDTFPFASIPILTNTTVLTKATMTDSGWLEPETAESLRASVYQNGELVKQVTMPFQVIDLTEVEPVNVDATAVMVDMSARFRDGIGNGDSDFSFTAGGSNSVTRAFNGNIEDMLGDIQEVTNPLFRVLITPSEDNSVFNVLIWGGYNSLNLQDFDYTQDGFSMDYQLMEPQLDFGVPSVNEIGEMAAGTYDPADTLTLNAMGGTHNNLDFGAQLEATTKASSITTPTSARGVSGPSTAVSPLARASASRPMSTPGWGPSPSPAPLARASPCSWTTKPPQSTPTSRTRLPWPPGPTRPSSPTRSTTTSPPCASTAISMPLAASALTTPSSP